MEEKRVFDENGFNKYGIHRNGTRFNEDGYDKYGFDEDGYDSQGFNLMGWNKEGINQYTLDKYDKNGFDVNGIYKTGKKYDNEGYDKDGFNSRGINRRHFYKDGTFQYNRNKRYDNSGYDIEGYNKYGFDENGRDRFGHMKHEHYVYSKSWDSAHNRYNYWLNGLNYKTGKMLDINGFDIEGYNRDGYDRDGYDRDGYDRDGYDRDGYHKWSEYNKDGLNRRGLTREQQKKQELEQKEETKKQQRKNFLGLKNKAEKLGKGEMTLEDYVKCSKTSIDDLIAFAKKENMDAVIIRGLFKHKKLYSAYKKPFTKADYLKSTTLIIDGQEVKPTEEDVDKCVEYLQVNGSLICDKTVRDTVRGYLKGDIDITIKEADLAEQIEENKEIISENEQKISDELVGTLIEQQDKIKSQQTEIINVKKKEVGTYGE